VRWVHSLCVGRCGPSNLPHSTVSVCFALTHARSDVRLSAHRNHSQSTSVFISLM